MKKKQKQWTKSVASQWGLFLPPARPSLSELVIFQKYLLELKSSKKNLKTAILCSTPEFRDLCQTNNSEYKCIDYNSQNFDALKQYLLHKDADKNLIVSDWRNMEFEEKFDLFIGDLVTTVMPVSEHEKIFRNINSHSEENARVILKIPLRRNNEQQTHKKIFQHYRRNLSYMNPFAAVWHEVLLADYDFNEDTMRCQTSLKKLKESFDKGVITKYEFVEFKKRWDALGEFKMNIPLRKEYFRKLSRYFIIEKVTSGTDSYKKWAPMLVLRVKL